MSQNSFPNLLTQIINSNSIDKLLSNYEMMINSQNYNNVKYKLKVQEFIDKIIIMLGHIEETFKNDEKFYKNNEELIKKFKSSFDKNPLFISMFKKKLINLLCMSSQFSYSKEEVSWGYEDEGKQPKHRKK